MLYKSFMEMFDSNGLHKKQEIALDLEVAFIFQFINLENLFVGIETANFAFYRSENIDWLDAGRILINIVDLESTNPWEGSITIVHEGREWGQSGWC